MSDDRAPSGRRHFLGASLGATTALLAGWRATPASALGANDRIRVAVIGTGGRARGLMKQLKDLPGQEMVAVSDVYEPRMLEAAEITRGKAVRGRRVPAHPRRQGRRTPSSSARPTTGTGR